MGISSFFNSLISKADKKDAEGNTRLFTAAQDGNASEVKRLLKKGADPNARNSHGLTALHAAAFWGELEIVEILINAGANPRSVTDKGWSVLHSAALSAGLKGRAEVMKMLIAKGADLNKKDKHGWTPVDYARLWDEEHQSDLRKLLKSMEFGAGEQPDMTRLGIKKPTTPHDRGPNARIAGDFKPKFA